MFLKNLDYFLLGMLCCGSRCVLQYSEAIVSVEVDVVGTYYVLNVFNVYSVAVQIEIYYNYGKLAVENCEAK